MFRGSKSVMTGPTLIPALTATANSNLWQQNLPLKVISGIKGQTTQEQTGNQLEVPKSQNNAPPSFLTQDRGRVNLLHTKDVSFYDKYNVTT